MKHLIVVGHPNKESFCYNGIYKTVVDVLERENQEYTTIDLYSDKLHRNKTELIQSYQDLVKSSTHIYFISPVWWFRMVPKMDWALSVGSSFLQMVC